jgi:hypothetical protein
MSSEALTEQERKVLDGLAAAWNAFVELPIEHPDDQTEFRHGIHSLQMMILSRPTRRHLQREGRDVT